MEVTSRQVLHVFYFNPAVAISRPLDLIVSQNL